jgi:hypothetical protein
VTSFVWLLLLSRWGNQITPEYLFLPPKRIVVRFSLRHERASNICYDSCKFLNSNSFCFDQRTRYDFITTRLFVCLFFRPN